MLLQIWRFVRWPALGLLIIYASAISYFHFVRNPLPWPDRGARVFSVPDERAELMVVAILTEFGIEPRFRIDTNLAKRAIMWDGTIVNVPDPHARETLGNPSAALVIAVDDPPSATRKAVRMLRDRGHSAEVHDGLDHVLPPGYLMFVSSNAYPGWVLVFRVPVTRLPMPKPWH